MSISGNIFHKLYPNKYKDNYNERNRYVNIFPPMFQNKFLIESLCKYKGGAIKDIIGNLNKENAIILLKKYPAFKYAMDKRIKDFLFQKNLLKKVGLTTVFWFGLLPKEEQAKYFQRIKEGLPWNKRKKQELIRTKTGKSNTNEKEVKYGVAKVAVRTGASCEKEKTYSFNNIEVTASCKDEAIYLIQEASNAYAKSDGFQK